MSNPVTPGQPYNPQAGASVPSAGSAPVYASYQGGQAPQTTYSAPGYPSAPSAPGMTGAPGVPAAPAGPAQDSLFTNLFDTTRTFAQKYGKIVIMLGAVAYFGAWLFGLIRDGMRLGDSYAGSTAVIAFIEQLLVGLVAAGVHLFMLRLVVEIAANLGKGKE
ncbi:Uncharacterised protein [Actinomyces bovis]|uniref:DUF4282 domain-containing protein n=1 Tax=Actinomyces bovis TaxID=1658 RepID=A0ABY1VNJ3_9ACTO|nr:hypothetical protein [Actinomyces bovis]SPT53666.1 Uncharacterised protein [Actinomyces bovis]VEG55762.1 Uncharacterised protein [Actinomyces israelii]